MAVQTTLANVPAQPGSKRSAGGSGWTFVLLAAAAVGACLCSGCYDGQALVEQVRSEATQNRMGEVDLDIIRTTMPSDPLTGAFPEVELHIFGTVPRYRVAAINHQLEEDRFLLRHELVAAVRKSTPEELAEPDLSQLRARISEAVNRVLEDAPILSIGFYDIRIIYQ